MIKRWKVFENNCFLILARHKIVTFVFFINVFINLNEICGGFSFSRNASQEKLLRDAFCFHIKVMRLRPEEGFHDEKKSFPELIYSTDGCIISMFSPPPSCSLPTCIILLLSGECAELLRLLDD